MHTIIDANNLLHARDAVGVSGPMGRETLVRRVEQWASRHPDRVTLVFDGPPPRSGVASQMKSPRITVLFSAPESADDVIIRMIRTEYKNAELRIVTNDKAIAYEARNCRCRHMDCGQFVDALNVPASEGPPHGTPNPPPEDKPPPPTPQQTDEWLDLFGMTDEDDRSGS